MTNDVACARPRSRSRAIPPSTPWRRWHCRARAKGAKRRQARSFEGDRQMFASGVRDATSDRIIHTML